MAEGGCVRQVRLTGFLCLGLAVIASGCGDSGAPKVVPVKGTVVFRGKPLANARVTFYAKGAPIPAVGDTNDAGEFELTTYAKGDGAVAGENKVTVSLLPSASGSSALPPDPTKIASGTATLPKEMTIGTGNKKEVSALPTLYSDSTNTPLAWTVNPEGSPDVKLELK
jgi:hypothetical protein